MKRILPEFSVVIPAYNEARRIESTLREIEVYAKDHSGQVKSVIVVDDGSTDTTAERVMYFMKRVPDLELIVFEKNRGKWSAIRAGLELAKQKTQWVLLLDADGSAGIEELQRMNITISDDIAVFGSRFSDRSKVVGKSLLRTVVSRGYRMYVAVLYRLAGGRRTSYIQDMQAPFKFFNVKNIRGELKAERFSGDVELALKLDCQIANHPIFFEHKRGSSIKPSTVLKMALETLRVCYNYRFRDRHA